MKDCTLEEIEFERTDEIDCEEAPAAAAGAPAADPGTGAWVAGID